MNTPTQNVYDSKYDTFLIKMLMFALPSTKIIINNICFAYSLETHQRLIHQKLLAVAFPIKTNNILKKKKKNNKQKNAKYEKILLL